MTRECADDDGPPESGLNPSASEYVSSRGVVIDLEHCATRTIDLLIEAQAEADSQAVRADQFWDAFLQRLIQEHLDVSPNVALAAWGPYRVLADLRETIAMRQPTAAPYTYREYLDAIANARYSNDGDFCSAVGLDPAMWHRIRSGKTDLYSDRMLLVWKRLDVDIPWRDLVWKATRKPSVPGARPFARDPNSRNLVARTRIGERRILLEALTQMLQPRSTSIAGDSSATRASALQRGVRMGRQNGRRDTLERIARDFVLDAEEKSADSNSRVHYVFLVCGAGRKSLVPPLCRLHGDHLRVRAARQLPDRRAWVALGWSGGEAGFVALADLFDAHEDVVLVNETGLIDKRIRRHRSLQRQRTENTGAALASTVRVDPGETQALVRLWVETSVSPVVDLLARQLRVSLDMHHAAYGQREDGSQLAILDVVPRDLVTRLPCVEKVLEANVADYGVLEIEAIGLGQYDPIEVYGAARTRHCILVRDSEFTIKWRQPFPDKPGKWRTLHLPAAIPEPADVLQSMSEEVGPLGPILVVVECPVSADQLRSA